MATRKINKSRRTRKAKKQKPVIHELSIEQQYISGQPIFTVAHERLLKDGKNKQRTRIYKDDRLIRNTGSL